MRLLNGFSWGSEVRPGCHRIHQAIISWVLNIHVLDETVRLWNVVTCHAFMHGPTGETGQGLVTPMAGVGTADTWIALWEHQGASTTLVTPCNTPLVLCHLAPGAVKRGQSPGNSRSRSVSCNGSTGLWTRGAPLPTRTALCMRQRYTDTERTFQVWGWHSRSPAEPQGPCGQWHKS